MVGVNLKYLGPDAVVEMGKQLSRFRDLLRTTHDRSPRRLGQPPLSYHQNGVPCPRGLAALNSAVGNKARR
jgi:hypothetical protein